MRDLSMQLLLATTILFVSTSTFAQWGIDLPPNAQPGKCYAEVLQGPKPYVPADTSYITYYRYTGDKNVRMRTRYHDVRIDPNRQVIERIEVQEPKKLGKIAENDLEIVTLTTYTAARPAAEGGGRVWSEIVCGSDVTPRLLGDIEAFLRTKGHYHGPSVGENVSKELKMALINYQRAEGLLVGQITMETLEFMDIRVR